MISEAKLAELEGICEACREAREDNERLLHGGRTEITLAYDRAALAYFPHLLAEIRRLKTEVAIRGQAFD